MRLATVTMAVLAGMCGTGGITGYAAAQTTFKAGIPTLVAQTQQANEYVQRIVYPGRVCVYGSEQFV